MKNTKLLSLIITSSISLYACTSTTVVNPSTPQGQTSPSPNSGSNAGTNNEVNLNTKAGIVAAYNCAIASETNTDTKATLQTGLDLVVKTPDATVNANPGLFSVILANSTNTSCYKK